MIFSCVVPFKRKKKKIPDLSLPPCISPDLQKKEHLPKADVFQQFLTFWHRVVQSSLPRCKLETRKGSETKYSTNSQRYYL
jgi:hypothetical protein